MRYRVYAVLDKAVAAFNLPICFRTEGEALRSFSDAVNQNPQFSKYREDYSFHHIGFYDDSLGQVEPTTPVCVAEAATIVVTNGKG